MTRRVATGLVGVWLVVVTAAPPAGVRVAAIGQAQGRDDRRARELASTLDAARAYVARYLDAWVATVAEESYLQYRQRGPDRDDIRRLRSELLLVRPEGQRTVIPFRDVFEVDGKPVHDRDDRLRGVLQALRRGAADAGRRIMDEGARYNVGGVYRNTNQPLLALALLEPAAAGDCAWALGGRETVEGVRTIRIDYVETARPTLVRERETGVDLPASGSFWIDEATGRVVVSTISTGDATFRGITSVVFRSNAALGMWVPAEMRERYRSPGRADAAIIGEATYTKFRRFSVSTDEHIAPPR